MDKNSLKQYLNSSYQGPKSFLREIIFPIFGEEDFENGYETELLDAEPERRQLAVATGIRSIKQLGNFYVGVEPLYIFDITVSDHILMRRNRVGIQRLIRSVMDQYSCAFMVFHYDNEAQWNWRFSFCQKKKSEKDITDSKRYTFLLGPGQSCRTARDNFWDLYERRGQLSVEDIQSAFSVEALSNEFFDKYKKHYEDILLYVTGKRYVKKNNKWVEEKIGKPCLEIMRQFAWFDDPEKAVRDYVKKLMGRIVFLLFLQKKGWLGVPAEELWGNGDREFIQNLFARTTDKDNFIDNVLEILFDDLNTKREGDISKLSALTSQPIRVPYLNGGLFERDAADDAVFPLPSHYMQSLLDFFSEYNFTIDENDPNDAEVGVDPEMLGRIFENLLEDNKDKGAYYTPKEIVQYMCRESLIAYLQTNIDDEIIKGNIRQFVTTHDVVTLGNAADTVDQLLKDVKICDPAIGSGAFPMGLLKELFLCRTTIEGLNQSKAAEIKKHIIQQNIYGVDIEKGAVDIARLRFWMSLVVDEENPQALPNLDYKIVEGNSLITTFDGKFINLDTKQQQHYKINEMRQEKLKLYQLKKDFYNANGDNKMELAIGIKDTILRLIAMQLGYESRSWLDRNAQQLKIFEQARTLSFDDIRPKLPEHIQRIIDHCSMLHRRLNNKTLSIYERAQTDIHFFDWRIMFTEIFDNNRPGFDIVIGNPPYVVTPRGLYQNFKWDNDLYKMFLELSLKGLCRSKGVVAMITPKFYLLNKDDDEMRKYFMDNTNLLSLATCNPFEAVTENVITIIKIESPREKRIPYYDYSISTKSFVRHEDLDKDYCKTNKYNEMVFGLKYEIIPILKKMFIKGTPLGELTESKRGAEVSKSFLRGNESGLKTLIGQDMRKYSISWNETYLTTTHKEYKRLKKFFESELIYLRRVDSMLEATISSGIHYGYNKNIYGIRKRTGCEFRIRYLLACINSKVVDFYYKKKFSTKKTDTFPEIQTYLYEQLPIPSASNEVKARVEHLVNDILTTRQSSKDVDTTLQEQEIDRIFYHLYDLTYDEVLIIDPTPPFTREEYENETIDNE